MSARMFMAVAIFIAAAFALHFRTNSRRAMPSAPPAISADYTPSTPTAPPAASGGYTPSAPSAPPVCSDDYVPTGVPGLLLTGDGAVDGESIAGTLLEMDEEVAGRPTYSTDGIFWEGFPEVEGLWQRCSYNNEFGRWESVIYNSTDLLGMFAAPVGNEMTPDGLTLTALEGEWLAEITGELVCAVNAQADAPAGISGDYTPSTPTAPPAASGSFTPSTPSAPPAASGNYTPSTPSAPPAISN